MKRRVSILLAVLLVLAGFSVHAEQAPALARDVLVLFTSDVHCGVDQNFTYVGLKAIRDAAKDAGEHVLLVDNGDSVQGESIGMLTQGMADIELMNAVGYDLAIPGNHEFDYGMERFYELVGAADFPYISCNFHKNGVLVFEPYKVLFLPGRRRLRFLRGGTAGRGRRPGRGRAVRALDGPSGQRGLGDPLHLRGCPRAHHRHRRDAGRPQPRHREGGHEEQGR